MYEFYFWGLLACFFGGIISALIDLRGYESEVSEENFSLSDFFGLTARPSAGIIKCETKEKRKKRKKK